MSAVLEAQHAAEALSLGDLGVIGGGALLFTAAWMAGSDIVKSRRARRARMDDRALEAWKRRTEAEAAARPLDWAGRLDFTWPSRAERRAPGLSLVDSPGQIDADGLPLDEPAPAADTSDHRNAA